MQSSFSKLFYSEMHFQPFCRRHVAPKSVQDMKGPLGMSLISLLVQVPHLVAVCEVVPALGVCLLEEHLVIGDGEDLQPSLTRQYSPCMYVM